MDRDFKYMKYSYCLNNPLKYTDPTGYNREMLLREWDREQRDDPGTDQLYNNYVDYWGQMQESNYRGAWQYYVSSSFTSQFPEGTVITNLSPATTGTSYIKEGPSGYTIRYASGTLPVRMGKEGDPDFRIFFSINIIEQFVPFSLIYQLQGQGGENFSLAGMYSHFQVGGGESMTINMSSIDFSRATQRKLGLTSMKNGEVRPVNLFNAGLLNQAALAFGRVNMMYHGNDQFSIVGDKSSAFNFSPLIDFNASFGRNAGNVLGAAINYNLLISPAAALVPLIFGGPYPVYFNGTTTIPR
jgi:hypothetical protein